MPAITIFTKPTCEFSAEAKDLLHSKGIAYHEIDVMDDAENRAQMLALAKGRRTTPQIFIGDLHVGGCDDLHELERNGQLDLLVKAA
jgi:glutaredoxin 3